MTASSPHYTVLARRFRPQTFAEVVGQQHVAQALRNAIAAGRVAHAYLFTGARGVGKTSMARILAKSLNCPQAQGGDPCNQCDVCQSISAGHDVDVLEIDGASNRGIDDIRSLRANVSVKSMRSRYKIYIIDEVHMLTKEAFNALLKTLEEPPESVKFVFCTTEPNKVPDTILSRCQRFDFASIETAGISERLRQIAEAEGVQVEPTAIDLVARRAAGSMRDSQSLFDQLLAFGEDQVRAQDVHRLLGTADDDRLIEIVGPLIDRQRDAVLRHFDRALAEGVQLSELIDQLLLYLRDLMVLAAGAREVALLSVSPENRDKLIEQAEKWGLSTILAALQILTEAKGRMFRASYARTLAEMALVRICLLEDLDSLGSLIQQLATGSAPAPRPHSEPSAAPSAPPRRKAASSVPEEASAAGAEKKSAPLAQSEPVATTSTVGTHGPLLELVDADGAELKSQLIASTHDMLKSHVQAVSRIAISGPNQLDFWFPGRYDFRKRACERPEVLARLQTLVRELTGSAAVIRLKLEEQEPESESRARPVDQLFDPAEMAKKDPFVEKALSLFGGTVVKVEGVAAPPVSEA